MAQQPGPGQPPVSFKTVPGRNRTQKWNTAKTYDYSGDDWGGYDAYDEYANDERAPPQQAPPPPQFGRVARQQSFDQDDDRRAFSGPGAFLPSRGASGSPALSNSGRPSNEYARRRDFLNPDSVPSPLNTRSSPAPGPLTA